MAIRPDNIPEQYKVVFVLRGDSFKSQERYVGGDKIVAALPEDGFSLPTTSKWEQMFPQGGEAVNRGSQALGFETVFKSKAFDELAWLGVEPLTVTLDFRLVTFSDPLKDVVKPVFTLRGTTLPSEKTFSGNETVGGDKLEKFTMQRPVSTSAEDDANYVSLKIGKWLEFLSIVPVSVDPTWSSTMCTSPTSGKAWPLFADVSIEFIASQIPTKENPGFDVNISTPSREDLLGPLG